MTAALGELAEFVNGVAFRPADWGEVGYPIVRIQNLTDPSKAFNRTTRSVSDKVRVRPGDLLVSWSATLGVFEWASDEDGLVNQHIFRVLPHDDVVEKRYLRHLLAGALDDMKRHLHGATMQHVNRAEFLGTRVPLPSLDRQRRIADILDRADALRAKRREALALLDDLTQSIFIDMFGDPRVNPHRWTRCVLGDLVTQASDGPHVSPSYATEGVPFLSTRHVRADHIEWSDLKYLSRADAEIQWRKCRPERGDVLYTKGGTTGLAAPVLVDDQFAVWVHVAVLKPIRGQVDPVWLSSMLNTSFCYAQSQRLTHGIANRDLGLKRMINIEMYAPPVEAQARFAEASLRVARLREQHGDSQNEADSLLRSLQQRAFAGLL